MPNMDLLRWGSGAPEPLLTHSLQDTYLNQAGKMALAQKASADAAETTQKVNMTNAALPLMGAAASGNQQAMQQLMAVNPETANKMLDAFGKQTKQGQEQMVQKAQMMQQQINTMDDNQIQQQFGGKTREQLKMETDALINIYGDPKWGQPQAAVGPEGPAFMQSNQYGQQRQVEGFQPRPQTPLVQIDNKQESAYAGAMGGGLAKSDLEFKAAVSEGVDTAQESRVDIERMKYLLQEGVDQKLGRTGALRYASERWLKSLGVNVDPADTQEFNRLMNKQAFDELARFKGPTSEKELAFAINLVGDITNEPKAIYNYILLREAVMNRNEKIYEKYQQFVDANGGNLDGADRYIRQWKSANPIVARPFTQQQMNQLMPGQLFVNPKDGQWLIKNR